MKKAFSGGAGAEQCRQSQNKSEFNSNLGFYNLGPSSFSQDSPGKAGPLVPSESPAFKLLTVFSSSVKMPYFCFSSVFPYIPRSSFQFLKHTLISKK